MEPADEPVAELEVVGSVYSFDEWSETLWVHRVNPCRTQFRGLALICRKISDYSVSLSLWVSWVLLSLGKLAKLFQDKECRSIIFQACSSL